MEISGNLEINAITLNTISRTSNSEISNPIYFLDKALYNLRSYKVKNITIPLSIYTIDSRNNKLLVQEDTDEPVEITLTPQNYTATQFASELKTKMDAITTKVYTITYNSQTNKFTITVDTGDFAFLDVPNNCYYEMGLTSDQLNVSDDTITSGKPADLSGLKVISVVCPSFSSNYTQNNYNIIASATINERSGDIASFNDNSFDYINIRENTINSLQFILIDERGRRLSVSNDWILTILFQTE